MPSPRLDSIKLLDLSPDAASFLAEALKGLSASPKTLPCKYLYDAHGSHLFDLICELDEYYPTRTELGILREQVEAIAERVGPRAQVIEFGSGAGLKTRILLRHLSEPAAYLPVEIARQHLLRSAQELREEFEDIEILPVCADFTQEFQLPTASRQVDTRLKFFPGSTVGNFELLELRAFLETAAKLCGPEGWLLLGVDLKKDPAILKLAYDDAEGVTARFNLNLLQRMNRELGCDFDLHAFEHQAIWNDAEGRVEMHLRSVRDQTVQVGDRRIEFAAGETIHTESSHKYSVDEFAVHAAVAGFELDRIWTDADELFSVQLYRLT